LGEGVDFHRPPVVMLQVVGSWKGQSHCGRRRRDLGVDFSSAAASGFSIAAALHGFGSAGSSDLRVCDCVCERERTHAHARARTRARAHTRTRVCLCILKRTRTRTYTRTRTNTHRHRYSQGHIHAVVAPPTTQCIAAQQHETSNAHETSNTQHATRNT